MKNQFNKPIHHNEKTDTIFKPPTIEQVIEQFHIKACYEKNEPEKFFYYYESIGWYVGKKKMRFWKAAVSGWMTRMEQFNKDKPTPLKNLDTTGKTDAIKLAEQQQIQRAYQNQRA